MHGAAASAQLRAGPHVADHVRAREASSAISAEVSGDLSLELQLLEPNSANQGGSDCSWPGAQWGAGTASGNAHMHILKVVSHSVLVPVL